MDSQYRIRAPFGVAPVELVTTTNTLCIRGCVSGVANFRDEFQQKVWSRDSVGIEPVTWMETDT